MPSHRASPAFGSILDQIDSTAIVGCGPWVRARLLGPSVSAILVSTCVGALFSDVVQGSISGMVARRAVSR